MRENRIVVYLATFIVVLIFIIALIEYVNIIKGKPSFDDVNKTNESYFAWYIKNSSIAEIAPVIKFQIDDNGKGVVLSKEGEEVDKALNENINKIYKKYGFNQLISDKISLIRTLPDYRHSNCSTVYDAFYEKLNSKKTISVSVSVIIVFYNEGWSTLLRTVFSVMRNTPKDFLREIVLVNDASTFTEDLHYINLVCQKFNNFIKIVNLSKHEGLIRAKNVGAKNSVGNYILFLDSHCEVTVNWLEPLIYPILSNYKVITSPNIDSIMHDTFSYKPNYRNYIGYFSWLFYYKEKTLSDKEYGGFRNTRSPVMAGGLFAISRRFWDELGGYDNHLYLWGGEQYELSFKAWMCGGELLNVPCSHVGHVYRGPHFKRVVQKGDEKHNLFQNYKRVAETLMQDYKYFLYMHQPEIANEEVYLDDVDDIGKRLRDNKCKGFEYYMRNVMNDTLFTAVEPDHFYGRLYSSGAKKCVRVNGVGRPITLVNGVNSEHCKDVSQMFHFTFIHEIKQDEHCFQVNVQQFPHKLFLNWCDEKMSSQNFYYDKLTKRIYLGISRKFCVVAKKNGLYMSKGDDCFSSSSVFVIFNDERLLNGGVSTNLLKRLKKLAINSPRLV